VNLIPFVTGEKPGRPHESLFWRTGKSAKTAVRHGDQKLAIVGEETFLFDLKTDLGETSNLAISHPDRVKALSGIWKQWNQKNQPAIFPGYRDYHDLLKAFHAQIQRDAEIADAQ